MKRFFVRKYSATFIIEAENRTDAEDITEDLVDAMHDALKSGIEEEHNCRCSIQGEFDRFLRELVEKPKDAK